MFGEVQEQEGQRRKRRRAGQGGKDKMKNIKNLFYNLISTRRDAANIQKVQYVYIAREKVIHYTSRQSKSDFLSLREK